MLRALLGLVATFGIAGATCQVLKDTPLPGNIGRSTDAVTFLDPGQLTIPAHRAAQVDLHFRVSEGLHINSHLPHEKSLIPARLAVVEAPGLNVTAVDFPPGTEFALQREKLSVYTGEFVLHAHMRAQPGEHLLQGALRYQACDTNACMPPHSIPVTVTVVAR